MTELEKSIRSKLKEFDTYKEKSDLLEVIEMMIENFGGMTEENRKILEKYWMIINTEYINK